MSFLGHVLLSCHFYPCVLQCKIYTGWFILINFSLKLGFLPQLFFFFGATSISVNQHYSWVWCFPPSFELLTAIQLIKRRRRRGEETREESPVSISKIIDSGTSLEFRTDRVNGWDVKRKVKCNFNDIDTCNSWEPLHESMLYLSTKNSVSYSYTHRQLSIMSIPTFNQSNYQEDTLWVGIFGSVSGNRAHVESDVDTSLSFWRSMNALADLRESKLTFRYSWLLLSNNLQNLRRPVNARYLWYVSGRAWGHVPSLSPSFMPFSLRKSCGCWTILSGSSKLSRWWLDIIYCPSGRIRVASVKTCEVFAYRSSYSRAKIAFV